MRKILLMACICFALNVQARAQLGESVENLKAKYSGLTKKQHPLHPVHLVSYCTGSADGFDNIIFSFFKIGDTNTCVSANYVSYYTSREEVKKGIKEAEDIIAKNFPASSSRPKLNKEKCVDLENADTDDGTWLATFEPTGDSGRQSAIALVNEVPKSSKWFYSVSCISAEIAKFYKTVDPNKASDILKKRLNVEIKVKED